MKLSQLLTKARLTDYSLHGDAEFTALKDDSRKVLPGDCFIAARGPLTDGHKFIEKAVKAGAACVICQDKSAIENFNIPFAVLPDSSASLGHLAQAYYDWPSEKLTLCGVTGTKGKTTVTYIIQKLLNSAGIRCGLIGTILCDTLGGEIESINTTPGALQAAQLLREMLDNGATAAVMEVSSQGLDQGRCEGLDFDAAIFTNLSGEHLDYHNTIENYLAAKARLFSGLKENAFAIINADDARGDSLVSQTDAQVMTFSTEKQADIRADDISVNYAGSDFTLHMQSESVEICSNLVGLHNVYNCMAAAGAALAAGLTIGQIAAGLSEKIFVPGRLQQLDWAGPFDVFVDYAHTDDALLNVLTAVRPLCRGRLIVLFGCGGDRDTTKRPRMARVAAEWADRIFVTQDNPRTEDPQKITDDILTGFTQDDMEKVQVIADRHSAIDAALAVAAPGDIVLLAGKGHETYQIIGTEKTHFDDLEVAREILDSRADI